MLCNSSFFAFSDSVKFAKSNASLDEVSFSRAFISLTVVSFISCISSRNFFPQSECDVEVKMKKIHLNELCVP